MDTLMKNVYAFADIVRQAGGDAITRWNDKSVNNAFNWASYCQRVYHETVGRPYRAELDRHIKALSLYMPSPCCVDLSLNALQHADILITQTLVDNPLLPARLLECIVDTCVKSEASLDSLVKVCGESCENSIVVHTLEEILDHLGVSSEDCRLESQAEILLTILTSQYQYSNNKERYQLFVSGVLKHLTSHSDGWRILRQLMCTGQEGKCLKETKSEESLLTRKERHLTHSNVDSRTERPSLEDVQEMVNWWVTENQV
ncbi:uncharacterized protein LOC110466246 isoform X2 [Mizuhopecten yessoensis]|uniref:Uncharacterized protein n=1 Tax=Mizuhopecten yessoensis TaxID=6573 RepID=A0A210PPR9_MIZYE|nr:uncharacterized protein LOC110466246 isoform X2 [Mizuhopecten yessoensis]OWF38495.1 hypothetical protein KP79_PYT12171 [Mizuhopecten yessoensis]